MKALDWRFETINSGIRFRDKFFIGLFYFLQVLTIPFAQIKNFDKFKCFFLSDVYVQNSAGKFVCRAGSWDLHIVMDEYEKDIRKYFDLKEGIFVDVGAHVGKYSVMVGNKLKERGKIIAIEPEPNNYRRMMLNASFNRGGF